MAVAIDPTASAFEFVTCPICGTAESAPYLSGPDRAHPRQGLYQLVRCVGCGLVYQNPRPAPDTWAEHYPPSYAPHHAGGRPSLARRLGWRHGLELYRRCRFVGRHLAGGELLDVGCATGTFLAGVQSFGTWRVWGIEPGLAAARAARRRGLNVLVARFEEVALHPASLDALTLWDVLEHLPDPVAALARARAALRPAGFVFLNVPVLDSLDARLFGPYWCGLDLPRHLTLFDRASLAACLAAAGLEPVSQGHPTGGHYSWTQSMRQVADAHVPAGATRTAVRRILGHPGLKAMILPYVAATELAGRGASLTVAARPKAGAATTTGADSRRWAAPMEPP